MAIILQFRPHPIEAKVDSGSDPSAAALPPADVIVFPRLGLLHLRSIAQAMQNGRGTNN